MMEQYEYFTLKQLSDAEQDTVLKWWSRGTKSEAHMLDETPESLKKSLLHAVIVYQDK